MISYQATNSPINDAFNPQEPHAATSAPFLATLTSILSTASAAWAHVTPKQDGKR
jgi:hypothetical protein